MPLIIHQIYMDASPAKCFDLARNVEIHTQTTIQTKEKAVAGVTIGLLQLNDRVTWEATHFGIKQRLTAEITNMVIPFKFTDVMIEGAFHSFTHTHEFVPYCNGTLMKDMFDYKAPYKFIGMIADKLFLERYMKNFIVSRATELKKIAETNL